MFIVTAVGAAAQDLYLGGYARNNTSMLLNDNLDFSQVQNTFDLKAEYFGDISALNAEVYLNSTGTDELDAGVKELYMDLYFDSMDLRIGKQQIIWGKADGVFITDVVSPKDLSNFVLPDFDEIRMGVSALKADWYLDAVELELVWVPMFTPSVTPSGLWTTSMPLPPGATINDAVIADYSLENSEVFAKVSYMGSAIDVELMGGYMWDDLPVPHMVTLVPSPTFTPQHHRLLMGGGSFSTDIAGVIIRGEGAYYSGKKFQTSDLSVPEWVVEKGFVHYMAGLDYSLAGITLGAQFIQEIILDYDDAMNNNDEFKSTMTFVMAKSFLNETLMLEFFSYVGLTNKDALLRPKATYDLADGLEWIIGADIFIGDSGDFGQYDDNDLIYTKIKYSF